MRKIIFFVLTQIAFVFLSLNLIGQSNSINIIGFGKCDITEKLYFLKTGESIGIDHLFFDLCDGEPHVVKVIDQDNAFISDAMQAVVNFYDLTNDYFDVDIISMDTKQKLFKLSRNAQGKAILKKSIGADSPYSSLIADEYFYFIQLTAGIKAEKKKLFDCKSIKLMDLQGQIISEYEYDSNNYYFKLEGLSSSVYFIVFTIEGKEILKKITLIN